MYTPQAKTVAAMANMVEPGGRLILVYEMILADFMWMTSQGAGMTARALRDFPYGLVTNLGWQPPESILGRRSFVSTWRTKRQLERLGFTQEMFLTRKKGRPFLGRPTQRILVMRRDA